jgi:hypothetical protein
MSTAVIRSLLLGFSLTPVAGAGYAYGQAPAATQNATPTITMTGCLERNPESASSRFVLNNAARMGTTTPRMGDPRVGAVGSATSSNVTPPSAEPKQSPETKSARYALDGADEQLAPHVNHRVEIAGTIVSPAATGTAAGGGARDSNRDAKSTVAPPERVRVTSVRMVAADCSNR